MPEIKLRWWQKALQFGKFWGFEHKGFSGYGCGYGSIGLGFEFGFSRDHCFVSIRFLDRGIQVQWERGF